MDSQNRHLDSLHDIQRMMQRSSRFLSLSGLSGVAAGLWALVGAWFAYDWLYEYAYGSNWQSKYGADALDRLTVNLLLLAGAVLSLALLSAFYFTWRKTKEDKVPLWNRSSRQLALALAVPLIAGGLFVLALLQQGVWRFVTPATLLFYGLALLNGSKYTLSDIRYLGLSEIALGLIATQYPGYGLYFWAAGFGLLHIVYGFIMWWKNERKPAVA